MLGGMSFDGNAAIPKVLPRSLDISNGVHRCDLQQRRFCAFNASKVNAINPAI